MASYPALDVHYAQEPGIEALHDLLYAELDAFEPLAIHDLEAGDGWRVFFRLAAQRDSAQAALRSTLGDRLGHITPVDVDDEDWARRSQAALTAIRVGRITVAPPWDVPTPGPESLVPNPEIVIVIEPSMGFGTGHHATTRLCLELLQTIDVTGKRAIDVGTGSGVLALAAWKLGASSVVAMDNDPDALQNARENIFQHALPNGDTHLYGKSLSQKGDPSARPIEVIEGDLMAAAPEPADIVLANLTGAVLQRHAATLRAMVREGGVLIVSGFSPDELNDVVGALNMTMSDSRREGDWAAATLTMST